MAGGQKWLALGLGLVGLAVSPASRADDLLTGGGSVELKLKHEHLGATPTRPALNDVYEQVETKLFAGIGRYFRVDTTTELQPVRSLGREDRFFSDIGFYVKTLTASVNLDPVTIYAGKFIAPFGIGWERAPGIYGDAWAGDYEFSERVGGGIKLALPIDAGKHVLNVAAFQRDTGFLSRSAFTQPRPGETRGGRLSPLRRQDGGLANSDGLHSFAASLSATGVPVGIPLDYGIGLISQHGGLPGRGRETGYNAWASTELKLGQGVTFTPLLEYLHFTNAGENRRRADYLLIAGSVGWQRWSVAVTGNLRTISTAGATRHDRFVTANLLYDLSDLILPGLNLSGAVRQVRENGEDWSGFALKLGWLGRF